MSRDVSEAAFQMVRRSTGTESFRGEAQPRQPQPTSSEISRVMAAMGRKGGKIGGKRRLVTMTSEERRKVAAKAAKTRWAKHVKK
jgi:hypothetical protein